MSTDKTFVGAYRYNPCWFCGERGILNRIFCCGRPVWDDGDGFALIFNDGVPFKTEEYPEWEKGTTLRNDFEKAMLGNKMKEALLESERDCVGGVRADKLAPHLNKEFCQEVNSTLLGQHGFRCEVKYWREWLGKDEPSEHIALAIYKNDAADGVGDGTPFLGAQVDDNRRVAR
ncbi:hypothetical protein TL16_g05236 [Triparma laevis f. inornata]|uniref:Uncharacterized protein n=1 Tax=Triparma laevis f. inornata TaxID=1714386 RepID=A0A9W7AFL9_9STRA|nr:hypothetical protein TL16_g05236 [Triparma laevis f. inornata]